MKVFFTCSKTGLNLEQYKEFDLIVIRELKRLRVSVSSTIEKTYLRNFPKLKKIKDLALNENDYKHVHDNAVRQEILRIDAVVIEASYPSFRLGFEAYYAVSIQKPVLVLSKYRNYGNLIKQPHFFGAKYTDFTLPDHIENFLKSVRRNKLRNRFNMFLTEEQLNKIENISKKFNISKSDYIRSLIEKEF